MRNSNEIVSLARILAKTSENIELMVQGVQDVDPKSSKEFDVYAEMILDELSHAQLITLELTKMMTYTEELSNADDGSVFATRELDYVKKAPEKEEDDE